MSDLSDLSFNEICCEIFGIFVGLYKIAYRYQYLNEPGPSICVKLPLSHSLIDLVQGTKRDNAIFGHILILHILSILPYLAICPKWP